MAWWSCPTSGSSAVVAAPVGQLADASRWAFMYSPGVSLVVPASPGFQWTLPTLPASMHYLVTPINRAVTALSMDILFALSNDAVLTAHLPDGSSPDDGVPGVRLYFQRQGDNLSGVGDYEFYRWWSDRIDIKNGEFTLSAVLDPAKWISVMGKPGTENIPLFQAAVAQCGYAGMTFGGWFAGHGVTLTAGTGAAIVKSFTA